MNIKLILFNFYKIEENKLLEAQNLKKVVPIKKLTMKKLKIINLYIINIY